MGAYTRTARRALRLAAAAWAAAALSGCAWTAIDADRSSFVFPQAIAARDASRARLSLVHGQAHHGLNVKAGAASRPAASRGTYHEAYQRWLTGQVRELPASGETAMEASN